MRTGATISGLGHGALIVALLVGLPERQVESSTRPVSTDVTLMTTAAFEAIRSVAPDALDPQQQALAAPSEDALSAPDVAQDQRPDLQQSDAPTAPDQETIPDASGLILPIPDLSQDVATPQAADPETPLGFDTPLIDAPSQQGSPTSSRLALSAPEAPHLAPRIDSRAAPKPPKKSQPAPEASPETGDTPAEADRPEPKLEAAPQEATTEIVPEAKPQDAPQTLQAAARPRGRPERPTAAPDPAPTPDPAPPAQAAQQAATPAQGTSAPTGGSRIGQDFTSAEARAIGDVIGSVWNKSLVLQKANYERLVIVIRVQLDGEGKLIGPVTAVDPRAPSGDFKIAFDAAKRAVIRAAARGLPLPSDKFQSGDFLEIRFDPGRDTVVFE